MKLGFIGTGVMGEPIARCLLSAGAQLRVWNRTPDKCAHLQALGAGLAGSAAQVFESCEVVLLMLLDAGAVDATIPREAPDFAQRMRGRTVINLGTLAPDYSARLAADIAASGGRYVEAPVSGSRVQAEQGRLLAMLAGEPDAVALAGELLAPVTSRIFHCGTAPAAMRLKLAVNHYLIVMVAGLAEAANAARASGLDLQLLREVIDAGPMASEVSRIKLGKLVSGDFSAQAAIHDVRTITELVADATRAAGASAPLMQACAQLYRDADRDGRSALDMIAIGARAA